MYNRGVRSEMRLCIPLCAKLFISMHNIADERVSLE